MWRKFFYGFIIVVLFFIGLSRALGIGGSLFEEIASQFVYPFLVLQKAIIGPLGERRLHKEQCIALLKQLEHSLHERERLQQEVIELKSAAFFIKESNDVREYRERYKSRAIVAQVLYKQLEQSHFYLIDKGTHKGIERDMIAVYKDCIVGKIVEVYPFYSKVLLLTDPACKMAAVCVESGTKGIHEGIKQIDMTRLIYVNAQDALKEGELVITSGEGLVFPQGFALGRVKQWESDGFTQTVLVTPLIDVKKIDYCIIVPKSVTLKKEENVDESVLQ